MEIAEKEFVLPASLYSRVAAELVQNINTLASDVFIAKNNRSVRMKSLLGVLSLGCHNGDKVSISCIHNNKDCAEMDMRTIEKLLFEAGDM